MWEWAKGFQRSFQTLCLLSRLFELNVALSHRVTTSDQEVRCGMSRFRSLSTSTVLWIHLSHHRDWRIYRSMDSIDST
ncbi:hypothetical protein C8J56DRAFT_417418 [Mycena floridula]|nr:hypothetical protein C8J56DRAFT_417418 [Mycena floridula]